MAKRSRTSPAEALIALVAMLPWWAGLALAVLSYFMLHQVATAPLPTIVEPGPATSAVMHSVWRALAAAGQYALPFTCVCAAAVSAWRRRERQSLVADVAQAQASNALDGMTWQEFEMLVGEGFRLQGYRVLETGGSGADGGIDLVLYKPGTNGAEKILVQCKQWRALRVGVDVVRELYGVMAARGAAGGFVVTSGRFTEAAIGFADGRNIQLIDGSKLHELIRRARTSSRNASVRSDASRQSRQPTHHR